MRRTSILTLAAVFALACADTPTSPLLEPQAPSLDRAPAPDYPPPPFAVISGDVSSEYGAFNFVGHLFINKPGNIAWLQFQSTTTAGVSFSSNARIMSVNGDVSGVGTISVNGNTIQLSQVNSFTYQTWRTGGGVSFGGGSILRGFAKGGGISIGDEGPVCAKLCLIDTNNGG